MKTHLGRMEAFDSLLETLLEPPSRSSRSETAAEVTPRGLPEHQGEKGTPPPSVPPPLRETDRSSASSFSTRLGR